MISTRIIFFLFCSLFFQILFTTSEQLYQVCSEQEGNFTSKSTYQKNLDQALTSLSSNTQNNYGFYYDSVGQNPDNVTALSLCRGDKTSDACLACINNATKQIRQVCPNQKEAIIWYDDCLLRYSNRSILGSMEFGPSFFMYNTNNVSDVAQFNQVVKSLLNNLTTEAASGNSRLKFATGNTKVTNNQNVYGLVQCTPDLSKQQCSDCMRNATALLPDCCNGRQGGRVIGSSCQFRYEISAFYTSKPSAPSAAPGPAPVSGITPSPNSSPTPSPSPSPNSSPTPPPPAPPPLSPSAASGPGPVSGIAPPPNSSLTPSPPPPTSSAISAGMGSNIVQTAMLSVISISMLNKF